MFMTSQKSLFALFIVIALAYLLTVIFDFPVATFYLKPFLLLPLLVATIFSETFSHKSILFAALAFCWAGDVLLLFANRDGIYFILGLVAFLIGHLFYILLFIKMIKSSGKKVRLNVPFLILILLYLVAFYWLMSPRLGAMLVPVMVYAVAISSMLYCAFMLRSVIPKANAFFIFSGAIAFVISDSILAVNKFYTPIPFSGFLIMITYIYAQGAIVWGAWEGRVQVN